MLSFLSVIIFRELLCWNATIWKRNKMGFIVPLFCKLIFTGFEVEIDVSDDAVGVVLNMKLQLVAFFSKQKNAMLPQKSEQLQKLLDTGDII